MRKPAFDNSHATVVYIEADVANAWLMQSLLTLATNYTLHHAANGLDGLELCRCALPDLVIIEMRLPDLTGHEILRKLRDDPATANLTCVALSGDAMPGAVNRALLAGFDGYWTKPIDVWHLLRKITNYANQRLRGQRKKTNFSTDKINSAGL